MNEDKNIKKISENLAIDLDDTIKAYGKTLYRLIAIADFKVKDINSYVYEGDKGGYISRSTKLYNSWVDSSSRVVGYFLTNTILINSSLIQDDITRDVDPDQYEYILGNVRDSFLENTYIVANNRLRIFQSSMNRFHAKPKSTTDSSYILSIFYSILDNTTIEIDYVSIKGSNTKNCFFSGTIVVENVRFSGMNIKNYFVCDSDNRNKSTLRLHHLKLNYDEDDLSKNHLTNHFSHVINHLGSRYDNLSIYTVFYRKEDDDIGADTYVSTGCFCGTLDEFKKAVEKKYKEGEEYIIGKAAYLYGNQYEATIRYIEDLVANHIIYLKNDK